eukprot:3427117-Rhodomonas_salina.1
MPPVFQSTCTRVPVYPCTLCIPPGVPLYPGYPGTAGTNGSYRLKGSGYQGTGHKGTGRKAGRVALPVPVYHAELGGVPGTGVSRILPPRVTS